MGPPSDSDRAQGDALCAELCQRVIELDSGLAKSIAALQKLESRGVQGSLQVGRLQRQIRELSTERRRIIEMLTALGHSYPCDHQGAVGTPDGGDPR